VRLPSKSTAASDLGLGRTVPSIHALGEGLEVVFAESRTVSNVAIPATQYDLRVIQGMISV
jgi:hypothetical protein